MPSFDYFATFDESLAILRDVCDGTFRVIAEPGLFSEPSAPTFEQITDELVAILKEAPNYYLAGSFTRHPVQFTVLKTGPHAGQYAINLLAQGPIMQGLMARVNVVDGKPTLLPGDISFQDKYRHPETNAWEPATPELKAAFRRVVAVVKKRVSPYEGRKDLFMSAAARAMLERGEAIVTDPRFDTSR